MKTHVAGGIIYLIVALLGLAIGSYIMTAVFFGTVMLVGFIAMVESIPTFKKIIERTTKLFDIIVFVFTIIATASYGLNVAASLTVAGLGYTLMYAPYVRENRKVRTKSGKKYVKPVVKDFREAYK